MVKASKVYLQYNFLSKSLSKILLLEATMLLLFGTPPTALLAKHNGIFMALPPEPPYDPQQHCQPPSFLPFIFASTLSFIATFSVALSCFLVLTWVSPPCNFFFFIHKSELRWLSPLSVKSLAPTLRPVHHFPPHRHWKGVEVLHWLHSFPGLYLGPIRWRQNLKH